MTYQHFVKKIYYDPQHPGSVCGMDKLYKAVRQEGKYVLGRIKIRKWLETQETFNLRRQIMRKFHRRKVIAPFINYQWDETRKSGPLLYPKRTEEFICRASHQDDEIETQSLHVLSSDASLDRRPGFRDAVTTEVIIVPSRRPHEE
jgi:hypothetical protein